MSESDEPTQEEIEQLYSRLAKDAKQGGYNLNPDVDFVKGLVKGLIVNTQRYGYQACPCRLAEGYKALDMDIICPCDYRDADLNEYGACYCGLYVSREVAEGRQKVASIPERRATKTGVKAQKALPGISSLPLPVWRCRVCGYLCAREAPPETCPICKAKKERFQRFL